MSPSSPRLIGTRAELKALAFLQEQGLRCLARNYQTRRGEIDLIMQDGDDLVFVEVRQRSSNAYGSGMDSVTFSKRRRLEAAAQQYLQRYGSDAGCRFDVVAIDGNDSIDWVCNAFDANS